MPPAKMERTTLTEFPATETVENPLGIRWQTTQQIVHTDSNQVTQCNS